MWAPPGSADTQGLQFEAHSIAFYRSQGRGAPVFDGYIYFNLRSIRSVVRHGVSKYEVEHQVPLLARVYA